MNLLRLHVIACPVFHREIELLAPEARVEVTTRFLDMGLHECSAASLRTALQASVDDASAGACDAVALAYGVCNRGIIGLQARSVPVIIPRAHDCIGILLGQSRRYLEQLAIEPGTYFQSAGWLEHAPGNGALRGQDLPAGTGNANPPAGPGEALPAQEFALRPGLGATRAELAVRYGEDNADYLLEQFAAFTRHYRRLAFISTPVPQAGRWEATARELARARGWTFENLAGDLGWLLRLLKVQWHTDEFLMLLPGERVSLVSDGRLIAAERG